MRLVATIHVDQRGGQRLKRAGACQRASVNPSARGNRPRQFDDGVLGGEIVAGDEHVFVERIVGIAQRHGRYMMERGDNFRRRVVCGDLLRDAAFWHRQWARAAGTEGERIDAADDDPCRQIEPGQGVEQPIERYGDDDEIGLISRSKVCGSRDRTGMGGCSGKPVRHGGGCGGGAPGVA